MPTCEKFILKHILHVKEEKFYLKKISKIINKIFYDKKTKVNRRLNVNFSLFSIISHEKSYKLCWRINKKLQINLKLEFTH